MTPMPIAFAVRPIKLLSPIITPSECTDDAYRGALVVLFHLSPTPTKGQLHAYPIRDIYFNQFFMSLAEILYKGPLS